jgi:hypothetical protein
MDLLAMPESWSGNKYAMVVMDYFSRYAIVAAIKDKTAETIANVLLQQVILIHGCPDKILSENGGEFRKNLMKQLCQSLKVRKVNVTPHNPQGDGMVERFNRTLLRLLACYVDKDQRNWDVLLPYVVYSYNIVACQATKTPPFNVVFARQARSLQYEDLMASAKSNEWNQEAGEHLQAINKWIKEISDEYKEGQVNKSNKTRKSPTVYTPGTLVWMAAHVKLTEGSKPKLKKQIRGPYVVIGHTNEVNVRVRHIGSNDAAAIVHINNIKPFLIGRQKPMIVSNFERDCSDEEEEKEAHQGDLEQEFENDEEEEQEEEFEVERIINHRIKKGELEFLVKWKDYVKPTWTAEKLLTCSAKVEEYFLKC